MAREFILVMELRGKRIAYAFGSDSHYCLLDAPANADLSERGAHLIPLDVNQMLDALVAGKLANPRKYGLDEVRYDIDGDNDE